MICKRGHHLGPMDTFPIFFNNLRNPYCKNTSLLADYLLVYVYRLKKLTKKQIQNKLNSFFSFKNKDSRTNKYQDLVKTYSSYTSGL